MTSLVVTGIGELVTNTDRGEGPLGIVRDAAVVVDNDVVAWVGPAASAPTADTRVDVAGRAVVPAFVDSHTHVAFGGERSAEFVARMAGEWYDGGGIASTVTATRALDDAALAAVIRRHVDEMRSQGTGLIEIKSGYGLDVDTEVRLLRAAREATGETTYLGAHVVPPGVDRREYVDLVTGDMLDACAPYARWGDVFCEPASAHAFDGDEAREVLTACRDAGLGLRVHGNQLAEGPGVQLAVELGAASVDHCTYLTDADVDALAGSSTVATLLPGVEYSTKHPYVDGGRLIEAGVTVALATDCNPGTCYTSSMPFVIALAVRECRMTSDQALWAATRGAALSLQRDDAGIVAVGRPARLTVLDAPSHHHLAYRPGVPLAHPLQRSQLGTSATL